MSIQWDANDDIFSFASANVLPMNRHSYQERNKHQQIMAKQQQNECDEKKWEQTHSDEKSRNNFQCKRECEWANANDCRLTNVNEKCCNIIQTLCAECVTKTTRNHIAFAITAKCLSVILPFANVEMLSCFAKELEVNCALAPIQTISRSPLPLHIFLGRSSFIGLLSKSHKLEMHANNHESHHSV